MTERYVFGQPGRASSEMADQTEAMIRCAALQAAATLVAVKFVGPNWIITDLTAKTQDLALIFEKHLRGGE